MDFKELASKYKTPLFAGQKGGFCKPKR